LGKFDKIKGKALQFGEGNQVYRVGEKKKSFTRGGSLRINHF